MSKLDPGLGRLGNFLYYGGLLLFPAALGSVIGFYAADQGKSNCVTHASLLYDVTGAMTWRF